jgi:hypothetical protein
MLLLWKEGERERERERERKEGRKACPIYDEPDITTLSGWPRGRIQITFSEENGSWVFDAFSYYNVLFILKGVSLTKKSQDYMSYFCHLSTLVWRLWKEVVKWRESTISV